MGQPPSPDTFPPIDFSGLILSFATSALVNLGVVPEPDSGELRTDMAMAKQSIDMLAMLQEKTRNNLSSEEDQLLQKLLLDVRLAFVQATTQVSGTQP